MSALREAPLFEVAGAGLARLEVQNLFGRYSYNIVPERFTDPDMARFVILYGDNGTGKTTILKLLYHVLSSAPRRSHRATIFRTPFTRFVVEFRDGRQVEVARPSNSIAGPYVLRLVDTFGESTSVVYETDVGKPPAIDQFTERLAEVIPETIYYIGDDRRIESDSLAEAENDLGQFGIGEYYDVFARAVHLERRAEAAPVPDRDRLLVRSLHQMHRWIQEQAIGASNVGTINTNRLYLEVAHRIARPSSSGDRSDEFTLTDLADRLRAVGDRNLKFNQLGLAPEVPTDEFMEVIEGTKGDRAGALLDVLLPFVRGLEARLDAVAHLYDTLTTFTNEVNSFFTDKELGISLANGVEVRGYDDAPLEPPALSSGEKQLLLLLTSTFYGREHGALYIIDEPELSLNMKWQRRLIDALSRITKGSATSFVMASHSFELMAGARERVVHLAPSV